MRFHFVAPALLLAALLVAACSGDDAADQESRTPEALTATPVEQAHGVIFMAGREQLTVDEYFDQIAELDERTTATTAALRARFSSGDLDVAAAQRADVENIGDFVIGLYALEAPNQMFTNHELRVQSLMGIMSAAMDRTELLEERRERDAQVCQETERLAASYGHDIDLECSLGDW